MNPKTTKPGSIKPPLTNHPSRWSPLERNITPMIVGQVIAAIFNGKMTRSLASWSAKDVEWLRSDVYNRAVNPDFFRRAERQLTFISGKDADPGVAAVGLVLLALCDVMSGRMGKTV